MRKQPNDDKVAEWAARLERFEATSLSVARFCKAEGVSTASLYAWRRKLAKSQRRVANRSAIEAPSFQRVELVSTKPLRSAVIRLPGEVSIELGNDPEVAAVIVESLVRHLPTTSPAARG